MLDSAECHLAECRGAIVSSESKENIFFREVKWLHRLQHYKTFSSTMPKGKNKLDCFGHF
jgi:hypothetical protein